MMDRYPDRPATASDGEAFALLCVRLHRELLGEDVGYYPGAREQLILGESAAGIEFKHLQKSIHRLHIETEERTSLKGKWFPSGIYANDSMTRYCCGNEDDIWVFWTADLRGRARWATDTYEHPTIRSFVLLKSDAETFYLYRFQRVGGCYVLTQRDGWWLANVCGRSTMIDWNADEQAAL